MELWKISELWKTFFKDFFDKNVFPDNSFFKGFFIAFKTITLYKRDMYICTAKNGHSKFFPTILFQFIPVLLEKNWNSHLWPFQIYTSLFGENCQNKFGTAIFGHSKCIPIFLEKIVGKKCNSHFRPFSTYTSLFEKNCQKNSEWPFLAILSLYQSFGKNCQKKFRMV